MKLLANGCSHTHGSETFSVNECQENIDLSYPRYVADHLNMDYINIAQSGCSNEYIANTTIEWIEKNGNPDFVVIGWTTFPRKTFKTNYGNFYWTPGSVDVEKSSEGVIIHEMKEYFRTWVTHEASVLKSIKENDFFHNVTYLNLYLKTKGIRHIMISAWRQQSQLKWPNFIHQNLTDMEEYIDPFGNANLSWFCEHFKGKFTKGQHVDAETHKEFGVYLTSLPILN